MESKLGRRISIILIIFCTLFTAAGQFFLKLFSRDLAFNISSLFNLYFFLGVVSYFFGAALLILSLKYGELSFVYPFLSLTYMSVLFLSNKFLGEKLETLKLVGISFVLSGVIVLGAGGRK